MTSRRPSTYLTAAVAVTALLVASCGDDDDAADAPAATDPDATASPAATSEPAATTAPTATVPTDLYGETGSLDTTTETTTEATAAPGDGAGATGVVTTSETPLGEVLVDAEGFTLYGFTPDAGGTPTCVDECAATWPPLYVEGDELPAGLDPAVFSVVEHPQGGSMLRAGGWPLYSFAGDAAPGDTNGQGVSGIWFVVDPAGELVEG